MPRKRGVAIRTLVTAAAGVALTLGATQLSAGTALAATVQSASAAAHATVQSAAATHWIIWSEDIASKEECYVQGETFVEYGEALDFLCTPTVVNGACSNLWTLELEQAGADAVGTPAKPVTAAC
jgi:hypothetical protein